MTKLMKWLFFGVLFISFWLSLVTKRINHYVLEKYSTFILFLPAILIALFGVYALSTVLWRVYTFNDCEDAAIELRKVLLTVIHRSFLKYKKWRGRIDSDLPCFQQIEEAKADLRKRGFEFQEKT